MQTPQVFERSLITAAYAAVIGAVAAALPTTPRQRLQPVTG